MRMNFSRGWYDRFSKGFRCEGKEKGGEGEKGGGLFVVEFQRGCWRLRRELDLGCYGAVFRVKGREQGNSGD